MPKLLPETEKLIPVSEAAQILGVSIDTIRRWDKKGVLHSERPNGKDRYFSLEELEKVKFSAPLTITEASKRLQISASTLRRLEKKGFIKPQRNSSGDRVYKLKELESFLASEYFLRQKEFQDKVLEPLESVSLKKDEDKKEPNVGIRILEAEVFDNAQRLWGLLAFRKILYLSALFLVTTFSLIVAIITVAFLLYPKDTAKFFSYKMNRPNLTLGISNSRVLGASTTSQDIESNVLGQALKPFSKVSLGIVKTVNPQVYESVMSERTIEDVNDVLVFDKKDVLSPRYKLRLTGSQLELSDAQVVENLNASMVEGRKPGDEEGNLVVYSINQAIPALRIEEGNLLNGIVSAAKIASGAVTSVKLSDGAVTASKIADASITSSKLASGALTTIAGLTVTDGNFIVGNGSNWVAESGSTARLSLGISAVENTALSTWAGSTNITTLGTITTGTWNGSVIGVGYGGTGTSTGSITGTGALTFTSGGTNQNLSLVSSGTGKVLAKPGSNSTTAFQVQQADGTNVLNVDTTNSRVGVGTTAPTSALDVSGTLKATTIRSQTFGGPVDSDDDFTIILYPDTQNMVSDNQAIWQAMNDWVINNKTALNIQAVMSTGDTTNGNTTTEYEEAVEGWDKIKNSSLVYVPMVGNHDYGNIPNRDVTNWNTYFGTNYFSGKSWFGGAYNNSTDNYYVKFDVGTHKYLVLALEFIPRDDVLTWAQGVLDDNTDREVILLTHSFLNQDGTRTAHDDPGHYGADPYGLGDDNDGPRLWEEFIKVNSNIFLIASGHELYAPLTRVIQDINSTGRIVNQVFANYQVEANGGDGYVVLWKFRPSLGKIEMTTYSTNLDSYDSTGAYTIPYNSPYFEQGLSVANTILSGSDIRAVGDITTFSKLGLYGGTNYLAQFDHANDRNRTYTLSNYTGYIPSLPQSTSLAISGNNMNFASNLLFLDVGSSEVGIGTTDPTGKLHVNESGAKTLNNFGLYITNTATSSTSSVDKYGLFVSSTGTWNGTSAKNYALYVATPSGGTNNYSRIEGNLGLGMDPEMRLDVSGYARFADGVRGGDLYMGQYFGLGSSTVIGSLSDNNSVTVRGGSAGAGGVQINKGGDMWGALAVYDGGDNNKVFNVENRQGVVTLKPSAFDKVYHYDGTSTYTDNTSEAKSSAGTAYTVFGAENPSNDEFYIGASDHRFNAIYFDINQAGVGVGTMQVKYASGKDGSNVCNAWTDVTGLSDGTKSGSDSLAQDGQISYTVPSSSVWLTCTVNGQSGKWVQLTSAVSANITTAPTAYVTSPTNADRFFGYAQAGDTSNPALYYNVLGNVGIGTAAPNNKLEVRSVTSPQLRLAYDTSNYFTQAVSSAGAVTFDATGSSAGFTFSDAVSVNSSLSINTSLTVTDDDWVGLSSSAARLEFDDQTTDEINFLDASIGIGTGTPTGLLNLRGYSGGTVASAVADYTKTLVIGGTYNQSYNTGNAVLLQIADFSNDGGDDIYPIYIEDENNQVNFYLRSQSASQDAPTRTMYFNGSVGIGTTAPNNKLEVLSTTTPQLRLAYDGTAYFTTSVAATTGAVTFDTNGSTPSFTFSDSVTANTFSSSGVTITGGSITGITDLAVADGGTGLSTIAAGSILAANSLDTLSAVTSTSGLKVLQNSDGTVSWASTTGTGNVVYDTSPSLTTPSVATSLTVTDDDWIGLGSGAGRIEFDDQTTDEVNILNANVGIGTSTPASALDVNGVIENGLVAYFPMDEGSGTTINDRSINSRTGTLYDSTAGNGDGNTPASWVTGKSNKGLDFDGTDDYGQATTLTGLQMTADISVEAWIKVDQLRQQGFLGRWGGTYSYLFSMPSTAGTVQLRISNDGSNIVDMTSTSALTVGVWYHIVAVKSGTNGYIYINGVQDKSISNYPAAINAGVSYLVIGQWGSFGLPMDGQMDEVKIYNRALSAREAADHYRQGTTGLGGIINNNTVVTDATLDLSDKDVAHGLTTLVTTTSYARFEALSGTTGGLQVTAVSDTDAQALAIRGVMGSADPTDSTAAVKIIGAKSNGTTGMADLGAAETVFQIANNDDAAAVTVLGDGKVGIGTTAPDTTLKVIGSLCVKSTDAACAGSTAGTIYATNQTVAGADLAENYVSSQNLEAGDIVSLAGDGNDTAVIKSTGVYQKEIIGIVSTEPGITLSSEAVKDAAHPNLYPIALSGRVPLKVSAENGPIKAGDQITSSLTPGVGMKATSSGKVVAQALGEFNGEGIGKIMVFVNTGYNGFSILSPQESINSTNLADISNVLGVSTSNTKDDTENTKSVQNTGDENLAKLLEVIEVGDGGKFKLDFQVLGKLSADGGLVVSGPAQFKGESVFEALAQFISKVIFKGDVLFLGRPTFNSDMAGLAKIKKVVFDKPYEQTPVINASALVDAGGEATASAFLKEDVKFVVAKRSVNGFTILLSKPATDDLSFSWTAVAVKDLKESISKQEATPSAVSSPASQLTVLEATSSASIETVTIAESELGYVRVRADHSTSSEEIGQVKPGDKFTVLEDSGEWVKVEYEPGKFGWVSKTYIIP